MAYDPIRTLPLVKARLNRLQTDQSLDWYLIKRIEATDGEFERIGIHLDAFSIDDMVLLADWVAEGHLNRDKGGIVPEWLRLKRRERYLTQARGEEEGEGGHDP